MNNTMKHSMESFERNTQPEMSDFGNENVDFFKDSIGHRAYCDTLSIFYSMTKFCYGNTPNVTWLARWSLPNMKQNCPFLPILWCHSVLTQWVASFLFIKLGNGNTSKSRLIWANISPFIYETNIAVLCIFML